MKGRKIMGSVILAHEFIHSLKSTRIPFMLIKLDLSKYFDRISWKHMSSLLKAFGFYNLWVAWIMHLTSSSVLMECPPDPFIPLMAYNKGIHSPPSFLS